MLLIYPLTSFKRLTEALRGIKKDPLMESVVVEEIYTRGGASVSRGATMITLCTNSHVYVVIHNCSLVGSLLPNLRLLVLGYSLTVRPLSGNSTGPSRAASLLNDQM